jgi:uncharacterized membrane protein HdeD (DUF308 family)
MTVKRDSNSDDARGLAQKPIQAHWRLFLAEGVVLIFLGCLAIFIPSIANANVTAVLGWLFLASGAIGLATTYWARQAPGFWWSLVSAVLAIIVGDVLVGNKSQDLYGGLMGWPFETTGPLRLILVLFFLVEGGAAIMFAMEHRRQFSGRWAWMLISGLIDIVLASIIIFNLPGTSAWTMGLLVAVNMIVGGVALIAMGMHSRDESAASKVFPPGKV